jgi:opacity protein-like surface antigen
MKNISAIILAFALMPAVSSAAQMVEIAPFAGHRYGGSFVDTTTSTEFNVGDTAAYGLVLDFDTEEAGKQIEVYLSRQNTYLSTSDSLFTPNPLFDLTIDYYHIGGLYMLPDYDRVRPYVSGSLGLTRMAPSRPDLSTEVRLSIALGGGAKYFFSKSLGVRFDVRGIYTAINSDSAVFCSGGCTIKVNSNGFIQTEVSAALMMRF